MLSRVSEWFAGLPTAAKLLLILTAALLPIGLGLVLIANQGIRNANEVLRVRSDEQSRLAAQSIESLIARNVMALRVASNGRIEGVPDPCQRVQRALTITPAVAQQFALRSADGNALCSVGDMDLPQDLPLIAPGDVRLQVSDDERGLVLRAGVIGGMAISAISLDEIRAAVSDHGEGLASLVIHDGDRELPVINPTEGGGDLVRSVNRWPIANGQLSARVGVPVPKITTSERLILLLPLLMWVLAAILTWLLVSRLLIRPLRSLQRAVARYQPGDSDLTLPQKVGPATEIQDLRDAFARAVERVEQSEGEMAGALEGQRRLVREVHHRVKNNLQVVASLLNIHGRSTETPEAREAYASISRRVGALAVVHRNHFAEMEDNRGISLRPLLSELAAELRAGAPEKARAFRIELDLDGAYTTQDVAVSAAFLVTEIIEYAMLRRPDDPVDVVLRRTSDLTAELGIASTVLVPEEAGTPEKIQFERIISGLAKQLRSDLDRKLGRYSVDLPVFPPE